MSIAIVASVLPPEVFSISSITRTSVSLSEGRFMDVVAVGLSPFSAWYLRFHVSTLRRSSAIVFE